MCMSGEDLKFFDDLKLLSSLHFFFPYFYLCWKPWCLGHTESVFSSKGRCLDVNEICNGDGTEKPSKNKCGTLLREGDLIMKINVE